MNPQEALEVLNKVTQPQAQGQLSRGDYFNIQLALQTFAKIAEEHAALTKELQETKAVLAKIQIDQEADGTATPEA